MKGNRKPKEKKAPEDLLIRRQYFIKPDQDEFLKKLSEERNVTAAEIIRELIEKEQQRNKAA